MGSGDRTSTATAIMTNDSVSSVPPVSPTSSASIVRLMGGVQNYAWGSTTLLPSFLGVEPDGQPQAELWLGAHPLFPSRIGYRGGVALDAALAAEPGRYLGSNAARTGNTLPFLMKVMAVASPLSIQVHPSKSQAEAGFRRENALGLAIDAANRNYRDANHKPEIICALREFELLAGFVDDDETRHRLSIVRQAVSLPTFNSIVDRFVESEATVDDRRALLSSILSLHSDVVVNVVAAVRVVGRELGLGHLDAIADRYPNDAGVLVAALMNYQVLQPGEAVFFAAGQTHAYLSGLGIELLANSDNVVRAGLTPKHIDIPELLRLCDPMPSSGEVVAPEIEGAHAKWSASCPDFALTEEAPQPGFMSVVGPDAGPRIALCTSGRVALIDQRNQFSLELETGQSAWVFPLVDLVVRCARGPVGTVGPGGVMGPSRVFLAGSPMLRASLPT
jgi:mannose-6-phosphate isomerase